MRPALRHACLLAGATGAVAACAPAVADGGNVVVAGTVVPGTLTVSPIPHRIAVPAMHKVAGGFRRAIVTVPITVVDARGSGAGWSLTLSASARTAKGHKVRGIDVSMWSAQLRCAGCTLPRSRVGFPLALYENRSVRAFAARRGTGMGRMKVLAQIAVTVPKKAPGGGYALFPRLSHATGP